MPPSHLFDYEVHPEVGASGSYFSPSLVGSQAVAATAALTIEGGPDPPYTSDGEHIVVLTDSFRPTDHAIEQELLAAPFTWSGKTDVEMK